MEKTKVKYLDSLQVYRGLAALFVVIHHNTASIRYYHDFDSSILNFIGQIGKYGVDFFFVLSGFIISYTSISKVNEKVSLIGSCIIGYIYSYVFENSSTYFFKRKLNV